MFLFLLLGLGGRGGVPSSVLVAADRGGTLLGTLKMFPLPAQSAILSRLLSSLA